MGGGGERGGGGGIGVQRDALNERRQASERGVCPPDPPYGREEVKPTWHPGQGGTKPAPGATLAVRVVSPNSWSSKTIASTRELGEELVIRHYSEVREAQGRAVCLEELDSSGGIGQE